MDQVLLTACLQSLFWLGVGDQELEVLRTRTTWPFFLSKKNGGSFFISMCVSCPDPGK